MADNTAGLYFPWALWSLPDRLGGPTGEPNSKGRRHLMPDPLMAKPAVKSTDPETAAREVNRAFERIANEVHKVIVGQDEVLGELLVALFCGGHALVVGVPGLAKTLLI